MIKKRILKITKAGMLVVLTATILNSCKITESYTRPENPTETELYRDVNSTDSTTIANIPWKELFSDPYLQSYIEEALANNNDLKIAVARIKKAEANFKQSQAALLPSLAVSGDATLQQSGTGNDATTNQAFELYGSSSWEADIWGKLRSTKRANLASLMKSDAYKRAVQTQLISDVATAYYTLLAYDKKLNITEKTLELRKEDVVTMKLLKDNDVVNGAAVVQSEASRYSTEVSIPDLKQNIYEAENNLCSLLGRNPGSIERSALDDQKLDVNLEVGVPAQLLANRPDVQEAEFDLRYYFEMTKVAHAYFYPSVTITAYGGFSSTDISDLFSPSSVFGNLIGGLAQPIFNQGQNKQRLKTAEANQEEYLYAFQQTLLNAGQEVSNALNNYKSAEEKIDIRNQQIYFLEKSVEFTMELLKYTSTTNYTDVLTSETSLLLAQINSVNDKLQQLNAVVTLYRSLGGGWKE